MKKQFDIKKLVLLNLPYLLMGLFATNFGEAWRLAQGANASEKFLSLFAVLPGALQSFWPSLHPLDLLVGLCCGAGLRLAVYLKSKNAKKYRHGMEYGSARWGTREDIAPYIDPVFQNNVILTKTESLTMNSRPKDPKTARNKNVLVIGGSGSGKTRFWLKPNLMQMHSSYVVTDPKGTILVECGKMLQRGAPKLGKDGKPMKDKHGKVIYEPYRIKVLNTINFRKSMHYNPFAYIHSEKDILKLVTTLIANTKGEGKAGDDFWVKAETLLYCALIGYIHYEAPVEEQNFSTNQYGEIEPKQEAALKELGFELPNSEKKRSKTNNRKVVFDSACRTMFLDICKRHGLELDEEPSYGGRKYLEKQDYIRMKQKEEIADQKETILLQIDKVNENRLELAKQSSHVRANEEIIRSQEEKIKQQDIEFANNSDRIFKQGDLIEEQREELQQLTVRIEDVETLLDEVSSGAYDKAVEKVAKEAMLATRRDDIRLAEDSKKWIQDPKHKASKREKDYAIKRLDGLIRKIETAMEKVVIRITNQLKQPEKKKTVVEEIKKEVKPSIRERLAQNVAKIQREEAERRKLNKGESRSSDLEI